MALTKVMDGVWIDLDSIAAMAQAPWGFSIRFKDNRKELVLNQEAAEALMQLMDERRKDGPRGREAFV